MDVLTYNDYRGDKPSKVNLLCLKYFLLLLFQIFRVLYNLGFINRSASFHFLIFTSITDIVLNNNAIFAELNMKKNCFKSYIKYFFFFFLIIFEFIINSSSEFQGFCN